MAAIDDLESQFQHCEWHGHLDESIGSDFECLDLETKL